MDLLYEISIGLVGLAVGLLVAWYSYRAGLRRGKNITRLAGGYCEVCNSVSEKFMVFRGTITCDKCFQSIMANKEMKCRFCNKPIEHCECV